MKMFITHVQDYGPFIQIYGQTKKDIPVNIEESILELNSKLDRKAPPEIKQLSLGMQCLSRYADGRFYRSKITSIDEIHNVKVYFLDYGNEEHVSLQQLRLLDFDSSASNFLKTAPPQATFFLLSRVLGTWNNQLLDKIRYEICNRDLNVNFETKLNEIIIGTLTFNDNDYGHYLVTKERIGNLTTLERQIECLTNFLVSKDNTPAKQYNVTPNQPSSAIVRSSIKNLVPTRQIHTATNKVKLDSVDNGGRIIRESDQIKKMRPILAQQNQQINNIDTHTIKQTAISNEKLDATNERCNAIATFKSNSIMIGCIYDVCCSYVDDGPNLFSVQLKSAEPELEKLMIEINSISLKNLLQKPSPGMACIARFTEDKNLYRAVIISISTSACSVLYVDYGNTEMVDFPDIYEIPSKFLEPKVCSIKFSLSGGNPSEPYSEHTKELFVKMVFEKNLTLKVMPLEGPPFVQYCELYDGKINILNYLKEQSNIILKYTAAEKLDKNFQGDIIIRYVESAKNFYVQLISHISQYDTLQDKLMIHCNTARSIKVSEIKRGMACAAFFQEDNEWFRAEVIDTIGENGVLVKLIDFGNVQEVAKDALRQVTREFLKLPMQSIECCLVGFEKVNTISDTTRVQLEMLAENKDGSRKAFKMCLIDILPNSVNLVNLFDEAMKPSINISKTLYKLSMPMRTFSNYDIDDQNKIKKLKPVQMQQSECLNSTLITELTESSNSSIENINRNMKKSSISPQRKVDIQTRNYTVNSIHDDNYAKLKTSNKNVRENFDKRSQLSRDNNKRIKNYSYIKNSIPRFNKQKSLKGKHNLCEDELNNTQTSSETSGNFSRETYSPELAEDLTLNDPEIIINAAYSVNLSWWINPHKFYIQLNDQRIIFDKLMSDIQIFYRNRKDTFHCSSIQEGSIAIVNYKQHNDMCRAKILKINNDINKYKVSFIDYGNEAILDTCDICPIDKRFLYLPKMAIQCSLIDIVSIYNQDIMLNIIDKYINDKTIIKCIFDDVRDGVYYVNLFIDGLSFKDILIKENKVLPLEPGINLQCLEDQTINLNLIQIDGLELFRCKIDGCETILQCSYVDINGEKNLDKQNKLSFDFKNKYEGKCCVAKVLRVKYNNILFVCPYIKLLNDYNHSDIICQPFLWKDFSIYVSHIETYNIIYIQHSKISKKLLNELTNLMNLYYENQGSELINVILLNLCAVKSMKYHNWCRAKILHHTNDDVRVQLIDYGNIETISKYNLKILETRFCEPCALANKVYLPISCSNLTADLNAVINEITELTSDYELEARIIDRKFDNWIISISCEGYSLFKVLIDRQFINGTNLSDVYKQIKHDIEETKNKHLSLSLQSKKPIEKDVAEMIANDSCADNLDNIVNNNTINNEVVKKKSDKRIEGILAHADNPERIYIQLKSTYDSLIKLQTNLQIVAGSLPPLKNFKEGTLCIVQYTVDEYWYRAKIIDSDSDITTIQFIDFGNTDVITNKNLLKVMHEAFVNDEEYALLCSLPITPADCHEWPEVSYNFLLEEINSPIQFEYIIKNKTKNFIKLYLKDVDISVKLIKEKLAKHLELVKSGENCYISHTNSLSDFYLQLEAASNGLELVCDYLQNEEKFPELTEYPEGLICTAQFPEDLQWYRAKILFHSNKGTEVLFIDYGNTALTNKLRYLSPDIANIPFLSKKCSLRMPENVHVWSEAAEIKFQELGAMGETIFKVELVTPGEAAVVDLFIGDRNILEDIEMLCEKIKPQIMEDSIDMSNEKQKLDDVSDKNAFVSHINSPNDFYLHTESIESALATMKEYMSNNGKILEKLENRKEGMLCAAKFPEDREFYRAKIITESNEGCEVLFVDFGNVSFSTDLRILPTEIAKLEYLAKHCALQNKSDNGEWNEEATIYFYNLSGNGFTRFKYEIVDENCDPCLINLYQDTTNINTKLRELTKPKVIEINSRIDKADGAEANNTVDDECDKIVSNLLKEMIIKQKEGSMEINNKTKTDYPKTNDDNDCFPKNLTMFNSIDPINELTENIFKYNDQIAKKNMNSLLQPMKTSTDLLEGNKILTNELMHSIHDMKRSFSTSDMVYKSQDKVRSANKYESCRNINKNKY